jgi:hypothetical protein
MLTAAPHHKCRTDKSVTIHHKSNAIPIPGRGALYGFEIPMLPHLLDIRLTDDGEIPDTRFC